MTRGTSIRNEELRRHQSRVHAEDKDPHARFVNGVDLRVRADEANLREQQRLETEAQLKEQRRLNSSNSSNSSKPSIREWPTMHQDAYRGLAGNVVNLISPQSESSPVALLLNFLMAFGNTVGRGPYYQVEGTRHCTNLFVLQVGDTAKARKGTAVDRIRQLFRYVDEAWETNRIRTALGSGEGVIAEVRDRVVPTKNGTEEVVDEGVLDKRLMIFASEFASVLTVMQREGNTLSSVIRDAFDRGNLGIVTKHNQTKATNALISVGGHITESELTRHLHETEMASGFANRFLFGCVRRARLLPTGGSLAEESIAEMAEKVKAAVDYAKNTKRVVIAQEALGFWDETYRKLSANRLGLLGALTARAEAHTVRLGLIYALLDQTPEITREHLESAVAVWNYCDASVKYLFGNKLGHPIADPILTALRQAPKGLTKTEISNIFSRNAKADRIDAALDELIHSGLIHSKQESKGVGAPVTTWFANE
jgi:hypothetical protein